jgi:uncharacterized BrkB/YihY/UPF0761 family membrane protein
VKKFDDDHGFFLGSGITFNFLIQDQKIVSVLGIEGLIWVSTWIFSSLRTALNPVFQVEKGRSLFRETAVDFLMVFLAGFLPRHHTAKRGFP